MVETKGTMQKINTHLCFSVLTTQFFRLNEAIPNSALWSNCSYLSNKSLKLDILKWTTVLNKEMFAWAAKSKYYVAISLFEPRFQLCNAINLKVNTT